jgi:histidine triad (HIT) family protein
MNFMSREESRDLNKRPVGSDDFYCDNVLSGKIPVEVVYESDKVLGFRHTRPAYKVHIMVIPKQHVNDFTMLDDSDLLLELMLAVQSIARDVLRAEGTCRVLTNLGEYQHNRHLHWQIFSWPIGEK